MRVFAVLVLFFGFVFSATANDDPYNSYRWNRKAYETGSSKIDRGDWYEWWYYKVVLPTAAGTEPQSFYFVYGVVNPWDLNQSKQASRAWTSFGNFRAKEIIEENVSPRLFSASYDRPYVKVSHNSASAEHLEGHIEGTNGAFVSWDINLEKAWAYNAMGWAMFVKGLLNIYWYPAQASARMTGSIDYRGQHFEFKDAPAYQDRNWGRTFPDWWAWLVSNNFKNSPGTVLAAGGGRPKVFGRFEFMEGMAIGLYYRGKEYTFRPNSGDTVKTKISFGNWQTSGVNRHGDRIEIIGAAPRERFMRLPFMTPQGKVYSDYETLTGNIKVKLYSQELGWIDLETDEGGIEFGSHQQYDLNTLFSTEVELK